MTALLFILVGLLLGLLRLYLSRRHAMVGLGYPLWMATIFSGAAGGVAGILAYFIYKALLRAF
jgi:hypothetical protein